MTDQPLTDHPSRPNPTGTGRKARGTFAVTLATLPTYHDAPGAPAGRAPLGRRAIDKRFAGDLVGVSRGEMLSVGTAVSGSAAYSALEVVEGTLHGRHGGFALQHTGVMVRGAPSLTITVAPDSGTGELAGLTGTMDLEIAGGEHHYTFAYTLPDDVQTAA